jgi:hypothetical protein
MARLGCDFTFLRRSFIRDIEGRLVSTEIPRMRKTIQEAFERPEEAIRKDRAQLEQAIRGWPSTAVDERAAGA